MDVEEPFILDKPSSYFNIECWRKHFPGIVAGFTSRHGGVSLPPYESMNMALHVGDEASKVLENRLCLLEKTGFPRESWVSAEQVHGSRITVVTNKHKGMGLLDRSSAIQDSDGMLTDTPGLMLASFYADCVPLFFVDPSKRIVGLAHAGWKGTVAGIAEKMIQQMQLHWCCTRESIHAAIGPAIGLCCYEVDDTVIHPMLEQQKSIRMGDAAFDRSKDRKWIGIEPKGDGKYQLDLKLINRQILSQAGLPEENIHMSRRCTSCEADSFFSYRRDRGKTGRMASFIGISET